jgi:hypothetical protein
VVPLFNGFCHVLFSATFLLEAFRSPCCHCRHLTKQPIFPPSAIVPFLAREPRSYWVGSIFWPITNFVMLSYCTVSTILGCLLGPTSSVDISYFLFNVNLSYLLKKTRAYLFHICTFIFFWFIRRLKKLYQKRIHIYFFFYKRGLLEY